MATGVDDLHRLWTFPLFDRGLRRYYGLDSRRMIRYDGYERMIYYVIRRSRARNSELWSVGTAGRFAVDAHTLDWLLAIEREGKVEMAYVVLVEDWKSPPKVVWSGTARALWERLERVVPFTSVDGHAEYWWLDDGGEPQDAWLGVQLHSPPF